MKRKPLMWAAMTLTAAGCGLIQEKAAVETASTAVAERDFTAAINAILQLDDSRITSSDTLIRLLSTAYYGLTLQPREGIGAECVDIDYTLDGRNVIFTDLKLGALTVFTFPKMRYITTVSTSTPAFTSDISPDGRHIATALENHQFVITDISTWQPDDVYYGHNSTVRGIAYADTCRIITCSNDRSVILWNIAEETKQRDYRRLHARNIKNVRMSPDRSCFITASNDGTANIVTLCPDSISRQEICLAHGLNYVNDAAIFPDGKTAVTVGGDGTLKMWNTADGSHKHTVNLNQSLCSVDISSDGALTATGGNRSVAVIDAASGRVITEVFGTGVPVWAIKFVNDSTLSFADNARFAVIQLLSPQALVDAARQLLR